MLNTRGAPVLNGLTYTMKLTFNNTQYMPFTMNGELTCLSKSAVGMYSMSVEILGQ